MIARKEITIGVYRRIGNYHGNCSLSLR